MQTIWAPWRMKYILAKKEQGCFLCKKAHDSADDLKNFVLVRKQHVFALMNIYPYNNGHIMIAPYAHVARLSELNATQIAELFLLTQRCEQLLTRVMQPEGFNVGINLGKVAGAGVEEHLHVHIVPRWNGDTNYMTTIAETRVAPESVENTYALLRPEFLRND